MDRKIEKILQSPQDSSEYPDIREIDPKVSEAIRASEKFINLTQRFPLKDKILSVGTCVLFILGEGLGGMDMYQTIRSHHYDSLQVSLSIAMILAVAPGTWMISNTIQRFRAEHRMEADLEYMTHELLKRDEEISRDKDKAE